MARVKLASLVLGLIVICLSWQLSTHFPWTHVRDPGYEAQASRDASRRGLCDPHGFSPFSTRSSTPRKVYDLLMVNTELDMLELRLETLYRDIDYFIIVESPKTFQGGAKNLSVLDNWPRFRRFHPKMILHRLYFPPSFHPKRAWDFEDLQRDATLEQVFPLLVREASPRTPTPGDVLLVSDVDEIPRPETVRMLRACIFPRRLTLASRFYYYSFQFLHQGPEWAHPQATMYQGSRRTLRPTNLRNGDGGLPWFRGWEMGRLANASWHCSSCFGSMEEFLNKMASFSHGWMNADVFREKGRIADAVRGGWDLWGREGEVFERLEGNEDVPAPLLGGGRFGYMLSRDGESAGFSDYPS